MSNSTFEWDVLKNLINLEKHGIDFEKAQHAFADAKRVIAEDLEHSIEEKRFYCFGKVDSEIVTVRFTYRNNKIRIFGAGYWRKGKQVYEKENKI
ncbi:MAG: BrnT family toxin [Melioribacteraceae bacterium]